MADLITFPVEARTRPVPEGPQTMRIEFAATVSLVGGQLTFSILYPDGPVARSTVAALLRRVTDMMEKKT